MTTMCDDRYTITHYTLNSYIKMSMYDWILTHMYVQLLCQLKIKIQEVNKNFMLPNYDQTISVYSLLLLNKWTETIT